jgi:hypothetical protein
MSDMETSSDLELAQLSRSNAEKEMEKCIRNIGNWTADITNSEERNLQTSHLREEEIQKHSDLNDLGKYKYNLQILEREKIAIATILLASLGEDLTKITRQLEVVSDDIRLFSDGINFSQQTNESMKIDIERERVNYIDNMKIRTAESKIIDDKLKSIN